VNLKKQTLGYLLAISLLALSSVQSLCAEASQHALIFFGDSLTAGYGLEEPEKESYPALIQEKINHARLPWKVINAGLSGDTTSGGLKRIDWVMKQPFDLIFIELGANDGLRGISPALVKTNLHKIIAKVRAKQPKAIIAIAGMQLPFNYGEAYRKAFAGVFEEVAKSEKVTFEPFLLDGVGAVPSLNQADGIHPNTEGTKVVAEGVWKVVAPLLKTSKSVSTQ